MDVVEDLDEPIRRSRERERLGIDVVEDLDEPFRRSREGVIRSGCGRRFGCAYYKE